MNDSADKTGRPNRIVAFLRRGGSFHLRILILVGIAVVALIATFPATVIRRRPTLGGVDGTITEIGIPFVQMTIGGASRGAIRTPRSGGRSYMWDEFDREGWRVIANYDPNDALQSLELECRAHGILAALRAPVLERSHVLCREFRLPDFQLALDQILIRAEASAGSLQTTQESGWQLTARLVTVNRGDVVVVRLRPQLPHEAIESPYDGLDVSFPPVDPDRTMGR